MLKISALLTTTILLLLVACQPVTPTPAFEQQVYIWQRQWTTAHAQALQQSQHTFSTLRVLAAQIHPKEGLISARILPHLLKEDGRPVIAVIRLDGQLFKLNQQQILAQIQSISQQWRNYGIRLQGIEIDHDCATSKLSNYIHLLRAIRQQLPPSLKLSITTLPTWLNSPLLAQLLDVSDSSVLQVHAVLQPSKGLFDAAKAQGWIDDYQKISPHPFYVALPAYSIALTASGQVESEVTLAEIGTRQEQVVAPEKMTIFIQQLQQQHYPKLLGLVWFRLPLATDKRAWAWSTLQAVIKQQPLTASLNLQATYKKGIYDLILTNTGTVVQPLPMRIEIAGQHCSVGDGLGLYSIATEGARVLLLRQRPASLAVNAQLALGWVRCQSLQLQDVVYVKRNTP